MSTLIQAVERVREQGQLPPDGPVSIRDLLQRFPAQPSRVGQGSLVEDVGAESNDTLGDRRGYLDRSSENHFASFELV